MADRDAKQVLKILATIGIGIVILGPIFSIGLSISGSSAVIHPNDNPDPALSSNDIPDGVEVDATTGQTAAYITDGGHTSFSASLNTSQSYTAATVVKLDADANTNATYTLLGHNYGEFVLQYHNGTYLAHVDNGNESATTTIPAPSPTQPTLVGLHYNATADSIQAIRGTNRSALTPLTNETAERPVSFTVDGWLDELRLVQGNLTGGQLARLSSTPAASLPSADRVARIMWDSESSSVPVYFTGTTASVTGATWTNGVPDPDLVRGDDYELATNPFTVHVLDGGLIEDAPIAYVSWSGGGPFGTLIRDILGLGASALTLIVVAAVAIAGRRALSMF